MIKMNPNNMNIDNNQFNNNMYNNTYNNNMTNNMNNNIQKDAKKNNKFVIVGILLVLIIVGVILFFVFNKKDKEIVEPTPVNIDYTVDSVERDPNWKPVDVVNDCTLEKRKCRLDECYVKEQYAYYPIEGGLRAELYELGESRKATSKLCTHVNGVPVISMEGMFSESGVIEVDLSSFNTSNIVNMSNMFSLCTELTSLDVTGFDTSKVTNMSEMLADSTKIKSLDLRYFDTSKVTDMSRMFSADLDKLYGWNKIENIYGLNYFNTSNVTDMNRMFENCYDLNNIDVSKFDTSKVTDMNGMFYGCGNVKMLDLRNFDTSNVEDMSKIFSNCTNLKTIIASKDKWTLGDKIDDKTIILK